MTQKGAAGEDTWAEVYNELGIPEIPERKSDKRVNKLKNIKDNSKRNKSSLVAGWYDTKYGRKLKIQIRDKVLWLSEDEAKKLIFIILKELLK